MKKISNSWTRFLRSIVTVCALMVLIPFWDAKAAVGDWELIGNMTVSRFIHTATVLKNWKVLVSGGFNGTYLSGCEIYDPQLGTWSLTGSLGTSRGFHSATLLTSGKVIVAGGFDESGELLSSEIYDPDAGTWSNTGNLIVARGRHTATLLENGKVLIVGGDKAGSGVTTELYDPSVGTWSLTKGSPHVARSYHNTATRLLNGKVLIAGGSNSAGSTVIATSELYDPISDDWSLTGNLNTARFAHTATLLSSGKVLVVGGNSPAELASTELYDPNSGTWSYSGSLHVARRWHDAIRLYDGNVMVVAGYSSSCIKSVELYDPILETWVFVNDLNVSRGYHHTTSVLPNNNVLVTGGGCDGNYFSSSEFYDVGFISHNHSIYLPAVLRPSVGLAGNVMIAGTPATGVTLDLRFFNGTVWSTFATTTTLVDGSYTFMDVPALTAGQAYYVRYLNSTDPSRVYTWHSGMNTTYNASSQFLFATFDISDIVLLKPDPGATVKLPYLFQWIKRPATLTDNYEYELFDPSDGYPYFYTNPPLGYVGDYTLTERPPNFLNGIPYGWDVGAYAPDGGFGYSYYYFSISFNSSPGPLTVLEKKSGPRLLNSAWAARGIPADR